MDIRMRELRRKDRPVLKALLEGAGVFRPEEIEVAMELIDHALAKPAQTDYAFLVAEGDDDKVAGYACWGATPCTLGTFDLYWIAADPACHGKGAGHALLLRAEEEMRRRGGRLCVIETSSLPQYEPARRFYLRHGYKVAAEIRDFYAPGDHRLIFTRALGEDDEG